eukprot:scaffold5166_cov100-Isochrysis_galbana.AAC.2
MARMQAARLLNGRGWVLFLWPCRGGCAGGPWATLRACSMVSTVPAPSISSGTCSTIWPSASAAAGVRSTTSNTLAPPAASARAKGTASEGRSTEIIGSSRDWRRRRWSSFQAGSCSQFDGWSRSGGWSLIMG